MGELKLKRYELPKDIHRFTKKEENELFPKPETNVLAYIDGYITLLTFRWRYCSLKMDVNGEFIRDGNGETLWSSYDNDYIISNNSNRPFEEYWAILE